MSSSAAPLRLKARVAIAFTALSLSITGVLAIVTWSLASNYVVGQRERGAVRQATVNAELVEKEIGQGSGGLNDLLTGLGADFESAVLLVDQGTWTSSSNAVDANELPAQLLAMVREGSAASQRIRIDGTPVLAVGLPIAGNTASYIEVSPLRELDRTLRFLSWTLAASVVVGAAAGAAVGIWAAPRALAPLTQLTAVAAAAAAGDLAVRLPVTRDPDLAPIATAFNATAERLQARVQRDARFASDVSHELRSPLMTMANAMAVLERRRSELSPPAASALTLLASDLDRFGRMVTNLLDISVSEQDGAVALEPVDVAQFVRELLRPAHGTGTGGIDLELPETPVLALVDRRRLEQVLANLVRNAAEHAHGATGAGVADDADGTVRIWVDDRGPGVPSQLKEPIFERFARGAPGERAADDHGAGLGLALVSEHARRMGGTVWVEDRSGGGARFVVRLQGGEL